MKHFQKGRYQEATGVSYHDWLTVDEAATEARVSRRTIYNWIEARQVRVIRTPSGAPRVDPASLWHTE
jgi:excisionase family DNA binding protein